MLLGLVIPQGWLWAGWIAGIVVSIVLVILSSEFSIWVLEKPYQPWDLVVVICEMVSVLIGLLSAFIGGAILATSAYDPFGIVLCWFAGFELLRCLWFMFRLATAPKIRTTSRSELWGSNGRIY